MTLDSKIEAVLFWKAEPVALSRLAKIFSVSEEEIRNTVSSLEKKLEGRGVALVVKDDEIAMRTSADAGNFIETLAKEELTKDLGKAGLETLSIILYQGPISRREIDYVRGVNSNFILRNLLVRGLVERVDNPKDQRSFLYRPTFDLLSYLGVSKVEDLPEYEGVKKEIEGFSSAPAGEEAEVLTESTPDSHGK